jgi:hypothetical protein
LSESIDELILADKLRKLMPTQKARIKLTPEEILNVLREEAWLSKAENQELVADLQGVIAEKEVSISSLFGQVGSLQQQLLAERDGHKVVESGLKSQLARVQGENTSNVAITINLRKDINSLQMALDMANTDLRKNIASLESMTKVSKESTRLLSESTTTIERLRSELEAYESAPSAPEDGKMKAWLKKVWNR